MWAAIVVVALIVAAAVVHRAIGRSQVKAALAASSAAREHAKAVTSTTLLKARNLDDKELARKLTALSKRYHDLEE